MKLKIEKGIFKKFELKEISKALEKGLSKNYDSVKAEVIDCPNLRNWDCPSEGMSGNQRIIDVGGEPYMHDPKYLGTEFDYSVARRRGRGWVCSVTVRAHRQRDLQCRSSALRQRAYSRTQ